MMTIQQTTSPFDLTEYLDSPEMIAEYINAVIEEGDQEMLVDAIGAIAKAQGMSMIAEKAHLNRQNLYKAFKRDSNPAFSTVQKVVAVLGVKLKAEVA